MDELRTIKPVVTRRVIYASHITPEDLEWIGASECTIACTGCGQSPCPLYKRWDNNDDPYCVKCLIKDWEQEHGN